MKKGETLIIALAHTKRGYQAYTVTRHGLCSSDADHSSRRGAVEVLMQKLEASEKAERSSSSG